MRWDDVFDDLEQQADGLMLGERDAEVAEQTRAEYARVDLAGRLHASTGRPLRVVLLGVGALEATLVRVGEGWCLLETGPTAWVVPVAALVSVRGLPDRAVEQASRPITSRLGLASALRGVAQARQQTVVHRRDGSVVPGPLGRVGADFVELGSGAGRLASLEVVPFAAIAAVRTS